MHHRFLKQLVLAVPHGQWTITGVLCWSIVIIDCHFDERTRILYHSTIAPEVHIVHIPETDEIADASAEHKENKKVPVIKESDLDSSVVGLSSTDEIYGFWSIKVSADGNEVLAGCTDGYIVMLDLNTQQCVTKIAGHMADVNAVAFLDRSNTNILLTGSDDGEIRVWDRRTSRGIRGADNYFGGNRTVVGSPYRRTRTREYVDSDLAVPCGVLLGHLDGITYIDTRGDGR